MKKTISVLLAGAMLCGTIPSIYAASRLDSFIDSLDQAGLKQANVKADADVKVKLSAASTYNDSASTSVYDYSTALFDFRAVLDMTKVKEAYNNYIDKFKAYADAQTDKDKLLADLEKAQVKGEFTVTIDNSDKLVFPDTIKADGKDMNGFAEITDSVFKETKREYTTDDKLIITIAVDKDDKGYVTKAEMDKFMNGTSDLTLSCENIGVAGFGTYTLKGTVEGSTKLFTDDGRSVATVKYDAEDSATVDVSKRSSSSSGGDIIDDSFTVTVRADSTLIDEKSSSNAFSYNPYDLPTPKMNKAFFNGWYNQTAKKDITGAETYSSDTLIVAKWIPTGNIDVNFVVDGENADVNTGSEGSVNVSENDIKVDGENTTIEASNIKVDVEPGMKFSGWYLDPECTQPADASVVSDKNITLYGKMSKIATSDVFNRDDHYAYIIGYPDETVRPEQNITREEVATIFFRLLKDDVRNEHMAKTNSFSDVDSDRWSNTAISTLENFGVITGYSDDEFKPAKEITRAEFTAIAARFYDTTRDTSDFTDCAGHWADKYIATAFDNELIKGYAGNIFKPDQKITRAEAMTLFNNILNRHVDKEGLLENATQWIDNAEGSWYYYDVLEATNSHKCEERTDVNANEKWTEITPNFDWSTLEK